MTRTVLMRAGDCSAISNPSKLKRGRISAPAFHREVLLFGTYLCSARLRLRPVVVRGKRVWREVEALRRDYERRIHALRLERLLEERALRAFFLGDDVPGFQKLDQDLGRRWQDRHAVVVRSLLNCFV